MIGGRPVQPGIQPPKTNINTPNVLNPTKTIGSTFSPTSRIPGSQLQFGGNSTPTPPSANTNVLSGMPSFGGTVDSSPNPNSAYTNAIKKRLGSIKGSNGVI